jgi:prolyl oligopeptidase PreP (S9A serine peptidase family)
MIDAESTAQIARINEMWRAKVMEALQDKELRKWCIEQTRPTVSYLSAAEIYKFITAPLADLLQEK